MRKPIFLFLVLSLSLTLPNAIAWSQMDDREIIEQDYERGQGMMGQGYGHGMMIGEVYGGYGMMGMMMGHMKGGCMSMGGMLPYLNLSPEQWEKVRALAYQRLQKMAPLKNKLFQQRLELMKLVNQGKVDVDKVKNLFIQQAELNADIFLAGLEYLQQVKEILTPRQKSRLQKRGIR